MKFLREWLHTMNFETRTEFNGHLLWCGIDYEVQEHPGSAIPTFEGWSIKWNGRYLVEYDKSLLRALRRALGLIVALHRWEKKCQKEEAQLDKVE